MHMLQPIRKGKKRKLKKNREHNLINKKLEEDQNRPCGAIC